MRADEIALLKEAVSLLGEQVAAQREQILALKEALLIVRPYDEWDAEFRAIMKRIPERA